MPRSSTDNKTASGAVAAREGSTGNREVSKATRGTRCWALVDERCKGCPPAARLSAYRPVGNACGTGVQNLTMTVDAPGSGKR